MKFLPALLASISLALFAAPPAARGEPSPVTIRVEQVSKSESDKKNRDKKTQKRSLKVFISNNSLADLSVKMKYTIFGKTLNGKDIVSVDSGEREATIKPHATETVETPTSSAVSEEEHMDKKTKVEASGTKMHGYGVQVFAGDKLLGEAFEPAVLKESLGKTVVAPKPAAAKK